MTAVKPTAILLQRLLDVLESDILPKTLEGVARGNKIFGATILRKSDLSLVLAETNNEIANPLWHGEVHALKRYYEITPSGARDTGDLVFLSTHEPCSMCLSAITWAGFDNFYYFFSHEDSRDTFAIPHDLKILKEVFGLEPGAYRSSNAYWSSFAIRKEIARLGGGEAQRLEAQAARISAAYDALSMSYQSSKVENDIPLR